MEEQRCGRHGEASRAQPLARSVVVGVSRPLGSVSAPSARWPLPISEGIGGAVGPPRVIRPAPSAPDEEMGGGRTSRDREGNGASAHLGPKRSRDRQNGRTSDRGRPHSGWPSGAAPRAAQGCGSRKNPRPARQARDRRCMVAGAGFEPTTSGFMSESEAVSPQILPIHSTVDMRLTCGFF